MIVNNISGGKDSLKFKKCFNDFCKANDYTGDIGYNQETKEYHIIISKDDDNAGAFMTREELELMGNVEIESLLRFLYNGFVLKFQK
jgi:hypothetical protein